MLKLISDAANLYRRGGVFELKRGIVDTICKKMQSFDKHDRSVAAKHLRKKYGRYYQHHLPGYVLELDLSDPGISTELAFKGIRERRSYWEYRNHLGRLNEVQDEVVVVEAGANIGYYALAAWVELDNPKIYAAEMMSDNIDRLRRNVALNDASEPFVIENIALGRDNERVSLRESAESNLHYLQPGTDNDIETVSILSFLESNDVDASDVDVLRMDVEGFDNYVLEGATGINPRLVHMEYHPHMMDPEECKSVLEQLRGWNLELVCASGDHRNYNIDTLDELRMGHLYELVLAEKE